MATNNQYKKPKRSSSKKKASTTWAFFYTCIFFIICIISVFAIHYRKGIQLYFCAYYGVFCNKTLAANLEKSNIVCNFQKRQKISSHNIRNLELIDRYAESRVFGIDVSEYQGDIDWDNIFCVENVAKIDFVILRATAGIDKTDAKYQENWKNCADKSFIRGVYHYYRPDEDPAEQAANFIKNVKLSVGDLPPVLDIEKYPTKLTNDEFIANLKTWLKLVEAQYKVKPILYSGQNFHETYLQEHFTDYVLWIANYNFFIEEMQPHWNAWQFSEKGFVNGIKGNVDVNMFRGSASELNNLTVK